MEERRISGAEGAFRRGVESAWPEEVPLLSCEELDSTSTRARSMLESGREPPFAVLAKRQTAGRGRRGKRFFALLLKNSAATYRSSGTAWASFRSFYGIPG